MTRAGLQEALGFWAAGPDERADEAAASTGPVRRGAASPEPRDRLLRELQDHFGEPADRLDFEVLSRPSVDDGPLVVRIGDARGAPCGVVLLSPPAYPHVVDRAMDGAALAAAALGPALGHHVLTAQARGRVDGRSYAVLPHCHALWRLRGLATLDDLRIQPAIRAWLREVTRATLQPADAATVERFRTRLEHVAGRDALDAPLRAGARHALERLESGAWVPRHVLMHGDLWRGNILLRPTTGRGGDGDRRADRFVIVDWPGASAEGYAIFDLVRLALSMHSTPHALALDVRRHCDILGCDPDDARGYLLAAIGHVGLALGRFPVERWAEMARRCHDALAAR
jgi:hypothetical protein